MIVKTNIKTYYLKFISKAKNEYYKSNKLLKETIEARKAIKVNLERHKTAINDTYYINFDKYTEYTNEEFNPTLSFYYIIYHMMDNAKTEFDKVIFIQCMKYCNLLSREHRLKEIIDFAEVKLKIKFRQYENYVRNFYQEVHNQVLQGHGYKFNGGIGIFIINHWKYTNTSNKQILDYAASNARKKELQAKGVKLYDDKEAAWYEARHIPYNAVDYRVFRKDSHFYEITFIKPNIVKSSSSYDYEHTEYLHKKYRGMSYTQIADKYVHTAEDLIKLQADIRYKLNILIYKNPTNYLNFVRNAEQNKYKHRENYCKD